MEDQLTTILINLGLTKKEALVYLSCVKQGVAPVSSISQAAKINRVTAYDILEKLKEKGLVSFFTQKKIRYFSATRPEIVLEEYEKRTNDLRLALPKLKQLTGETHHPRIRYFEGLEGIKTIYADSLTSQTEILNYSNTFEIRAHWANYDEEYVDKRVEKKIFLRGICPDDYAGKKIKSKDPHSNRELRLIPAKQFDFTNEINIYDDKVAIVSFKNELIGMIIESAEIANSQRAIFEMCWQFASAFNKKKPSKQHESIKTKLLQPLKEKEIKDLNGNNKIKSTAHLKNNLSLF